MRPSPGAYLLLGQCRLPALGQSPQLTFWAMFLNAALNLLMATLVPSVAITRTTETMAAE